MRPELQIRNVRLVDGSGAPARPGCLDISGGRYRGGGRAGAPGVPGA